MIKKGTAAAVPQITDKGAVLVRQPLLIEFYFLKGHSCTHRIAMGSQAAT